VVKGDQNGRCNDYSPPYLLSRLTFAEIEREIVRFPAVVLPPGGSEPYGPRAALGLASACSEAIASALSRRYGMLMAPTLHYGCSTPYSAFGGAAGMKPRTLTNILCEILRRFRRQGICFVVIIDPLLDNGPALDETVNRLKKWDRNLRVVTFGLQREERVQAFIGRRCTINEFGRSEFVMLALASHIDPRLVRVDTAPGREIAVSTQELYRKWRRRGADPQQFRLFFPDASTGMGGCTYDSKIGGELLEFIIALIDETIAPLLSPLCAATGALNCKEGDGGSQNI
jgi:creatinine amidohydrolase/Fe(II)-dependent formamide hydrolase-like protein